MKFTLSNPEFNNPSAVSISKWITFARIYSLILGVIQLIIVPLVIAAALQENASDQTTAMMYAAFAAITQLVYGAFLVIFARKLRGDYKTVKYDKLIVPLNWLAGVSLVLAVLSYMNGAPSAFLLFMHAVVCGRTRLDIHKYIKQHRTPVETAV